MKIGTADLCHKESAIAKAILRGVILGLRKTTFFLNALANLYT